MHLSMKRFFRSWEKSSVSCVQSFVLYCYIVKFIYIYRVNIVLYNFRFTPIFILDHISAPGECNGLLILEQQLQCDHYLRLQCVNIETNFIVNCLWQSWTPLKPPSGLPSLSPAASTLIIGPARFPPERVQGPASRSAARSSTSWARATPIRTSKKPLWLHRTISRWPRTSWGSLCPSLLLHIS